MSIFSNKSENLFAFTNKAIQFGNKSINVVSGINTLAGLPLCSMKMPYDNYQRINVKIPAGAKKFVLAFPTLGITPTFLAIVPKYCGCNKTKQYLYWNFIHSSDAPNVMTTIMMLTGTTTNPIQQIVLSNPDENNPVILEILIASTGNDYLDDVTNYVYISELIYENIFVYDVGILGINDKNDNLYLTVDLNNIVNFIKVPNKNRIIIDDSTQHDIVLDFITKDDAYQTLSILNWLINNPATPATPVLPRDDDAPEIEFNPGVVAAIGTPNQFMDINLINYPPNNEYDKQMFIQDTIISCIDLRDGSMHVYPVNVTFLDSDNVEIVSIVSPGTYKAIIKVRDIANNKLIEEIQINAI